MTIRSSQPAPSITPESPFLPPLTHRVLMDIIDAGVKGGSLSPTANLMRLSSDLALRNLDEEPAGYLVDHFDRVTDEAMDAAETTTAAEGHPAELTANEFEIMDGIAHHRMNASGGNRAPDSDLDVSTYYWPEEFHAYQTADETDQMCCRLESRGLLIIYRPGRLYGTETHVTFTPAGFEAWAANY